jgi:hypothetical protein
MGLGGSFRTFTCLKFLELLYSRSYIHEIVLLRSFFLPFRLGASCRVGVEASVDHPVPEVLEAAVAGPRVAVELQGLEIGQAQEHLFPDGSGVNIIK